MKVLVVAHSTEKSGAPRVAVTLAAALRDRGHDVAMLFPGRGDCAELAESRGLPVCVVNNPAVALSNQSGMARVRLAVRRVGAVREMHRLFSSRRDDCVFISSYVAVLAGIAARLAGRPVVFHVHEDVVPTRVNRVRMAVVKWASRAICFVAERSRASFGVQPAGQRWELLPNYIEPPAIAQARRSGARRAEFGSPEGAFVFLCAAFVGPRKGIDILLKAWAVVTERAPGARLWIVGAEAGATAEYLAGVRGALGATAAWFGHRDDVPSILGDADAFVLASRNEALPLSILEAMHAGLPVVATDVGDVARLVRDGKTGRLVPPEDPAALAAAMLDVMSDRARATAWGSAGRELAERDYNRETILTRLEEVLGGVASSGARTP